MEYLHFKKELAKKYFGGKCYICHKNFGKGFAFHHLYYSGQEPNYNDKKRYYNFIFKQIENNPKQFLLLCKSHHFLIDRYLKRMNEDKWRRVCRARKMSQG